MGSNHDNNRERFDSFNNHDPLKLIGNIPVAEAEAEATDWRQQISLALAVQPQPTSLRTCKGGFAHVRFSGDFA